MIGQILPNNNERCYSNFSPTFREVNTPNAMIPAIQSYLPSAVRSTTGAKKKKEERKKERKKEKKKKGKENK
jgi:hypothetical protein